MCRRYIKEDLEIIVKNSVSIAEVIKALKLVYSGGQYNTINR